MQFYCKLGTADSRNVEHRVTIKDWYSKTRTELIFEERLKGGTESEWEPIYHHIQFLLKIEDIESEFPYISLWPLGLEEDDWDEEEDGWDEEEDGWDEEEDYYQPRIELSDGRSLAGESIAYEIGIFTLSVGLNTIGEQMYEWIQIMEKAELLAVNPDGVTLIDVAPWHHRDV